MSILDICIIILVFLVGLNLKNLYRDFSAKDKRFLNLLFLFHMGVAFFFHFYITQDGGDAIYYWEAPRQSSLSSIIDLALSNYGTGFMYLFNYVPSAVLQLDFLTGNLMYAFFGYIGFMFLFRMLKHFIPDWDTLYKLKVFKISIFPWIWFLPNFHFWTSGIGKDTILFTCIISVIYAILNLRSRWPLLLISSMLIFAVRPHILLFLVISIGFGLLLDGKLKGYQKISLGILAFAFLVLIFDKVMSFVQLDNLETTAISEFASKRSANLNKAETLSGIDISSYPYPLKVFTFLYRPLFFDVKGLLFLLASVENFIILIFSFVILWKKPFYSFRLANFTIKAGLFFFLIGALSFSLVLGNLGIMLRQKNMFMPWLIIFGIWTLHQFLRERNKHEVVNSHQ